MQQLKKTSLPSGAVLGLAPAPFRDAKALYQAILAEMKALKLDPEAEVDMNFRKDIFCALLSSKAVEEALWACLARVTYNGQKVTEDTFEPVEARDDYFLVCLEVAKENVLPFTKSLSAVFSLLGEVTTATPA